jgi:acyl-CoA reductase-like NAD-dependent aldehyde dehydrogenase
MTSAAPAHPVRRDQLTGSCVRKLTDDPGLASPGPAARPAGLKIRDPADQRSVVAEVPAMRASDVAAAYERARAGFGAWRQANPLGLRFYARLKTAAVRFAW